MVERVHGLGALIAALAMGCDEDPRGPTDASADAAVIDASDVSDVNDIDAMDATVASDVPAPDVGFDRPVMASEVGGRVRSCAELMRFFDCEGDLHTCFQFDPSGDQGQCDTPGVYCENWWNCGSPGNRRLLDWDCYCGAAEAGLRWRCVVRAVCDAGVTRD